MHDKLKGVKDRNTITYIINNSKIKAPKGPESLYILFSDT